MKCSYVTQALSSVPGLPRVWSMPLVSRAGRLQPWPLLPYTPVPRSAPHPSLPPEFFLPSFPLTGIYWARPHCIHTPGAPMIQKWGLQRCFRTHWASQAREQAGSQAHEHRVAWWQRSAQRAVVPLSQAAVGREWRRTCQWKTAFSKTPLEKHSNSQTHPQSVYSFQHHS